jgi:hypothetical protein
MNTINTFSKNYETKALSKDEIDEMFNPVSNQERGKELEDFTKCVKGNPSRFMALCNMTVICGSELEAFCCKPVDKDILRRILRDAGEMIIYGNMKVNGKVNNWSNGNIGSRWFDMDAKKYGVNYIRGAFYSKKHYKSEWKCDTPYAINIIVEKAR